jgi:hypothetical protein
LSHKQEITEPNLEAGETKALELDEQPKPTRKISHPNIPVPDIAEPSTMLTIPTITTSDSLALISDLINWVMDLKMLCLRLS